MKDVSENFDSPIFKLPPFKVTELILSLSETVDWGLNMLNIPSLWRATEGEGINVAVLDTGIALNHPDLAGAVIPDGARDFTSSPHGIGDQQGHGTHCAGIIAARRNHLGVAGVAPKCNLLVGKVLSDSGSGTGRWIAEGVAWAVEKKADVISMSLGSQVSLPEVHDAIIAASEAGVFVIAAAGNDSLNHVDYPGAYSETVTVGSINRNRRLSSYSSIGPEVSIVAPGEDIKSCYPPYSYATLSGTSMATPFVAGVVALTLAKHRSFGGSSPITSRDELIRHLLMTATDMGAEGFDDRFGYGLINPESFVQA